MDENPFSGSQVPASQPLTKNATGDLFEDLRKREAEDELRAMNEVVALRRTRVRQQAGLAKVKVKLAGTGVLWTLGGLALTGIVKLFRR